MELLIRSGGYDDEKYRIYKEVNNTVELDDTYNYNINDTIEFVNRASYFCDSQPLFHGVTDGYMVKNLQLSQEYCGTRGLVSSDDGITDWMYISGEAVDA